MDPIIEGPLVRESVALEIEVVVLPASLEMISPTAMAEELKHQLPFTPKLTQPSSFLVLT